MAEAPGCPLCEDQIRADEESVDVRRIDPDSRQAVSATYHSRCFMDIVNIGSYNLSLTGIVSGKVEKESVVRDLSESSPTQ